MSHPAQEFRDDAAPLHHDAKPFSDVADARRSRIAGAAVRAPWLCIPSQQAVAGALDGPAGSGVDGYFVCSFVGCTRRVWRHKTRYAAPIVRDLVRLP